jgi:hypothetical protein
MKSENTDVSEFIIEYDYFGLSSSADVKKRRWRSEPYYQCFLRSSSEQIDIKQVTESAVSFWIDMSKGTTTPLSQILGMAIENKICR